MKQSACNIFLQQIIPRAVVQKWCHLKMVSPKIKKVNGKMTNGKWQNEKCKLEAKKCQRAQTHPDLKNTFLFDETKCMQHFSATNYTKGRCSKMVSPENGVTKNKKSKWQNDKWQMAG